MTTPSNQQPEATPGPWKIEKEEVWAIIGKDGGRLATLNWLKGTFPGQGRRSADEVRANAELISSAPNLLSLVFKSRALLQDIQRIGQATEPELGPTGIEKQVSLG